MAEDERTAVSSETARLVLLPVVDEFRTHCGENKVSEVPLLLAS